MEDEKRFIFLNQFKLVFFQKSKGSELLLRSLLNAILAESLQAPIKGIIRKQNQRSYFSAEQQSSWWIEAETEKETQLSIRFQIHEHNYFQKQSIKLALNHRLDQITSKHQLEPERFVIHILNFNLLQESGHYHHRFQPTPSTHTSHRETLQIHYLELPKFTTERPETPLEKWLYFICHLNGRCHPRLLTELVKKDPYFKLAMHLQNHPNQRLNHSIMVKEEPLNLVEWQYFGEQQEKERIALRMIQSGIPYQQIVDFTELTVHELDELALTIPMLDS